MDDGKGRFNPMTEETFQEAEEDGDLDGKFRIGQIVKCNGSTFKVSKIMRKRLMLKLLPRVEIAEGERDQA